MPSPDLPADGELRIGGLSLPAGKKILAGHGSGRPVAWATARPVRDPGPVWQALSEAVPDTGLVPFLLAGLDPAGRRPWDEHEFSDPADVGTLAHADAAALLAGLWSGEAREESHGFDGDDEFAPAADGEHAEHTGYDEPFDDEHFAAMVAPFTREFPGLAPAADAPLTPQDIDRVLGSVPPARIGLAAASRPADVLPLIGWDGAANRWPNALVIAAVLRSWEDRFGARLLRVGFDEIQVLAERPPRTVRSAQLLAAEQFAFCDECAGRGLHDISSITDHLLRSPVWTFWWD